MSISPKVSVFVYLAGANQDSDERVAIERMILRDVLVTAIPMLDQRRNTSHPSCDLVWALKPATIPVSMDNYARYYLPPQS